MSYRHKHIKRKIRKAKPRKSIFKRPGFWLILLLLVVLASFSYLLFFYPELQINNIVISGNQKINAGEIQNLVLENISQKIINLASLQVSSKSILLVSADNLCKEILEKFPVVENVRINKNYPQTLSIAITERKQVAVFCNASLGTEGKCYSIDKNGVIFEDSSGNPENMPVIWHPLGGEVSPGQSVMDKNAVSVVVKTEKMLKNNFQINITDVFLPDSSELDIKTSEGWSIYFNLGSDIDMQITKVKILLEDEISETARKNLKYIDMRFKDRAYYK